MGGSVASNSQNSKREETAKRIELDSAVVRFAGDSGDGMVDATATVASNALPPAWRTPSPAWDASG